MKSIHVGEISDFHCEEYELSSWMLNVDDEGSNPL